MFCTSSTLSSPLAHVCVEDCLVAHDPGRCVLGNLPAVVDDHHSVCQFHGKIEVVVDKEDGLARLFQIADYLKKLWQGIGEDPGCGLVKQEELRAGPEGAGNFQESALAVRKVFRLRVPLLFESDHLQKFDGLGPIFLLLPPHRLGPEERRPQGFALFEFQPKEQVVEHRHLGEKPDILEGSANAEVENLIRRQAGDLSILEKDPPAGWPVEASDQIEGHCLPRAVGTDERRNTPGLHSKGEIVHRSHAVKVLGQPLRP